MQRYKGFTLLQELLFIFLVMAALTGIFIPWLTYSDSHSGAKSSRFVISEIDKALDRYYLSISMLNNESDSTACNDIDVTLALLISQGFLDANLLDNVPEASFSVRFIKTAVQPIRVRGKEVVVQYDSVKTATSYASYLTASYQDQNRLVFNSLLPAKGKGTQISSNYRNPSIGCWQEASIL